MLLLEGKLRLLLLMLLEPTLLVLPEGAVFFARALLPLREAPVLEWPTLLLLMVAFFVRACWREQEVLMR